MRRSNYQRNPGNAEKLKGEDTLEEGTLEDLNSIFAALRIKEDPTSVLEGETAEINLYAELDHGSSADYAIRVQSNEPVEGILELKVSPGESENTYLGRVEMGAQEIFSLKHLADYDPRLRESDDSIEYKGNERMEAD
ncbi:MAG: hypothetical protein ABEK16_01825 [Candidatus Nanohalobium sp.]